LEGTSPEGFLSRLRAREVQSECVEVERPQGVIPITARFNQQGTDVRNAIEGEWGSRRISRANQDGLLMSNFGCAVVFVANVAFTHDSQTTITPETIRQNPNAGNAKRTYFLPNGSIWWVRPLYPLGFRDNHIERSDDLFTAEIFAERMRSATPRYYICINVNTTGRTGSSTTDHWVGASELVVRPATGTNVDTEFFRISPTSANDWNIRNPDNTLTDRGERGWQVEGDNIYVPLTQLRPGFRIFTRP